MLLLAADNVEENPGTVKYPCRMHAGNACARPIKSNQQGTQCEVCYHWVHAKCIMMSTSEYDLLSTFVPLIMIKLGAVVTAGRKHIALQRCDLSQHLTVSTLHLIGLITLILSTTQMSKSPDLMI